MTASTPLAQGVPDQEPAWHTLSVEEALCRQQVKAEDGLNQAEVATRCQQFGLNTLPSVGKEPGWRTFLHQYRDPMQLVLLVAGIISGLLLRQWGTALVLVALTLLNAIIGLRQEGKAEASIAALQKMLLVKVRARRDGQVRELPAEEIVPGDVVLLEAGDKVPADGRLIKAATLEVDESALTGESVPVPKQIQPVAKVDTPLGDRTDMAYMNTNVTRGAGELLVTATGATTEVGHISGLLQSTPLEETPLTRQLNRLTHQILVLAGGALLVSLLLGFSRGQTLGTLFVVGVAFAVSAIPTGLPAVVTYLLATGTTKLAQEGAIVKRLRSVETLGSTSAINSDKTGTLTLNQMTAVEMAIPGQRFTISGKGYSPEGQITRIGGDPPVDLEPYLLPMVLASDAVVRNGALVGDPTEGALVVLAAKGGIDIEATRQEFPRIAEVPFDAAYKLMATFHRIQNEQGQEVIRCYVKGAPDQLLARSEYALDRQRQTVPLVTHRDRVLKENERLGQQGLRVMALARKDFDPVTFRLSDDDLLAQVTDLTLLALVGIVDPPRPEARDAIASARSAGITVRMITGDHAVTAAAIAKQLGIPGRAIAGADFAAMSDEEALQHVEQIGVIARVTPEQKVRLVDLLKKTDKIVAMTGDGVNDAPALKKADIGVAMGITGTEVAKEAAVMVLTDDNFATIVRAVDVGRALYDNLIKYIRFQMGNLFGFILIFLGAGIFNILRGIPFLPLQSLWINFTVELFLAIGIGTGAPTPGLMKRPPRSANEQVLPRRHAVRLAIYGLLMAISTLGVMSYTSSLWGETVARTMGLTTFSLAHIFFALDLNNEQGSVFSLETLENRRLLTMSGWALLTTYLITALGFMNRIFATAPLGLWQWVICIAVSSLILWVGELMKLLRRRRGIARASERKPSGADTQEISSQVAA
ncbi:MAG TPA: HAD-IC family P-type ATPase [Ktedonobacterales bacterium]|jgi:Ca2+-transporting ATPase